MSLSRERLHLENPLISQPFTDDFARRFSWSTNAIEGNTLSLEETIAVIDYDEGLIENLNATSSVALRIT